MNNNFGQNMFSSKQLPTQYSGQDLRQTQAVPSNLIENYSAPQSYKPINNISSYNAWSNNTYQSATNKQWWQPVGSYRPYRTTYQDYGPPKEHIYEASRTYQIQPYVYTQDMNTNNNNRYPFEAASYSTNGSIPFTALRAPMNR